VDKTVENFEPVEKKDKGISFPQFPQVILSTTCGKVENFV
jgi:hypothetical protein